MRHNTTVLAILIGAVVLLLAGVVMGERPCRVTAEISPKNPQVGERVLYTVRVECSAMEETPQLQLPELSPDSGISDFAPAGTFQQISITNGRQTRTQEFRYTFVPKRAGTFRIPPTTIAVDGEIYETNEVEVRVGQSLQAPDEAVPPDLRGFVVPPRVPNAPQLEKALAGKVFILAVAETTQPVSGQQFLLSYHLFIDQEGLARTGLSAKGFRATEPQLPQLKDFLKEELYRLQTNLRFEEQVVGGRRYAVAPIYQVALTPTRSGRMTIEPVQMTLLLPSRQQRSRGILDDSLFDDVFSLDPFDSQRLAVIAQSIPIELDVKPLPTQGKPANFCGAVGKFTLEASVDKDHLVANEDVARLRVILRGEGNASVAVPPPFPESDALRLLEEPKSSFDRKIENNKLITSKTFDYIFRATRDGKIVLPPIETAIFNPKTGQYELLRTNELTLVVAPGTSMPVLTAPVTSQPATVAASRAAGPEVRKDLRYIHEHMNVKTAADLRREHTVQSVLIALAATWLVSSAILARRRRYNNEANARYRRGLCHARLRETLRRLETVDDSEIVETSEKLAGALRDYFASLLGLSIGALTTEELCTQLATKDVPETLISELRQLLETCDSIRYAPGSTSSASLRASAPRLKQVVEEVSKCLE